MAEHESGRQPSLQENQADNEPLEQRRVDPHPDRTDERFGMRAGERDKEPVEHHRGQDESGRGPRESRRLSAEGQQAQGDQGKERRHPSAHEVGESTFPVGVGEGFPGHRKRSSSYSKGCKRRSPVTVRHADGQPLHLELKPADRGSVPGELECIAEHMPRPFMGCNRGEECQIGRDQSRGSPRRRACSEPSAQRSAAPMVEGEGVFSRPVVGRAVRVACLSGPALDHPLDAGERNCLAGGGVDQCRHDRRRGEGGVHDADEQPSTVG